MRFLVTILVLTLGFSGYSTAAHAFGVIPCEQENGSAAEKAAALCQHVASSDAHDHQDKIDKSDKSGCTDCHHCCTSSAVNVLSGDVIVPLYDEVVLSSAHDSRDGSFIFQLHRPPKSLVS